MHHWVSIIILLLLHLLHHLHPQRILILHHFHWLLLFLVLLLNGALLQLPGLFALSLLFSFLLIEFLLVYHVLLLQLLVFAQQKFTHVLVVVALQLHSSQFDCRTRNCKFFTALLGDLFCVDICIV